jgi:hypothetical protein
MALGRKGRGSVLVDALIGAASGLAASWLMDQAQARVISGAGSEATRQREKQAQGDLEPATVRAAERAAALAGRSLSERQKGAAGEAIHYGTGAAFGAIFGVLAARMSAPAIVAGALFGVAVWLLNDETLVPTLGLSKKPWEYPASTHAKALASHLVFGTATGTGFGLLHAAVH